MKLFTTLRHTYMRVSQSSFPRVVKVYDHCPHCDEKTPWAARALQGFARCLQCGNDPLSASDDAPDVLDADTPDPHRIAA